MKILFFLVKLRAMTLDEGPTSRDQWIQAFLLVESFKLNWSQGPLDKGPRAKEWQIEAINLHGTLFWRGKNQLVRTQKKTSATTTTRRAPYLENQELGLALGTKV